MITYKKFTEIAVAISPYYFYEDFTPRHEKWCAKKNPDGEANGEANGDEMDEKFCRGWLIDEITKDVNTLAEIERDDFNEEDDEVVYRLVAKSLNKYAKALVKLAEKKEERIKASSKTEACEACEVAAV